MKSDSLAPYQAQLVELMKDFVRITDTYLAQEVNQFVDALAKLASIINILSGIHSMSSVVQRRDKPAHCCVIEACYLYLDALILRHVAITKKNGIPARILLESPMCIVNVGIILL